CPHSKCISYWVLRSVSDLKAAGSPFAGRPHWSPYAVLLPGALGGLLGLFHPLAHLRFYGVEIEARAALHRRIIEEGLQLLGHHLLHEHEAPELELEPVEVP